MFSPNNINFRLVSSQAISEFKSNQSIDLSELIHSKDVAFSATSREIILLNYDRWFQFLLRIERSFIASDQAVMIGLSQIEHIRHEMRRTMHEVRDVMVENPKYFGIDIDVRQLMDVVGKPIFHEMLYGSVATLAGYSIYTGFTLLATMVSEAIHQVLIALKEIEILKSKHIPTIHRLEMPPQLDDDAMQLSLAAVKASAYTMFCRDSAQGEFIESNGVVIVDRCRDTSTAVPVADLQRAITNAGCKVIDIVHSR